MQTVIDYPKTSFNSLVIHFHVALKFLKDKGLKEM